jgi:hypothetical protein
MNHIMSTHVVFICCEIYADLKTVGNRIKLPLLPYIKKGYGYTQFHRTQIYSMRCVDLLRLIAPHQF